MRVSRDAGRVTFRGEFGGGKGTERDFRPIAQKPAGRHEMFAGGSVDDGIGATGVVADHASDHGAVGDGGLGSKEEPVRLEESIQFVADDPRLYRAPAS